MAWPEQLRPLSLPVIGAPMFIISNPDLVIAQCSSGVIGAFPALNARPQAKLAEWLARIKGDLALYQKDNPNAEVAPFAVNQIIHPSNDRLAADLDLCEEFRVPIIITSLSAPKDIVPRVKSWGGLVFHDVISLRHAKKAIEAGVDGLILVASGAGGHAGPLSPFALTAEVRQIWQGPLALAGAITTGRDVLAARVMGADFAYMGTRFIATPEANAPERYKEMILNAGAEDILNSAYFTGVPGNYLRQSVVNAGLDPEDLPAANRDAMDFSSAKAAETVKAWRDIWGAGQGVGSIKDIIPTASLIERLRAEYAQARRALCG
ncbi:MAG TPA: nitronate monooxygenase family protein [Methylocella sp.]|nr:nitronate monooxygenase family protein [Methylocella sp.]